MILALQGKLGYVVFILGTHDLPLKSNSHRDKTGYNTGVRRSSHAEPVLKVLIHPNLTNHPICTQNFMSHHQVFQRAEEIRDK